MQKKYTKSEIDKLFFSTDWNTFYTGMLMRSELSLYDPSIEVRIFSDKIPKLQVVVTREAQIQMYIWNSILNDKSFLKDFSDEYKSSLYLKAKDNWGRLRIITNKLKRSEDLILEGVFKSSMLDKYGKTKDGYNAWGIRQDNSNRFVYTFDPEVEVGRTIEVIDCMFHYRDEANQIISENIKKDRRLQYTLWSIYMDLTQEFPWGMDKFQRELRKNYLLDLFENS
jgi:Txe/YoeB family toxin of Txe-Axe toxin-antitoxin module